MKEAFSKLYKRLTTMEIICLLLIFIIGIFLIISSVHAIDIYPVSKGTTYIEWNFSEPIKTLSIDGDYKRDVMNNTLVYISQDLEPNTKHVIQVTNLADEIFSNTTTTLRVEKTSSDKIIDFIYEYWIMLLVIVLLLVGIRIPLIAVIGFLFAFGGLLTVLTSGNYLLDWMYVVLMLACFSVIYLAIKEK